MGGSGGGQSSGGRGGGRGGGGGGGGLGLASMPPTHGGGAPTSGTQGTGGGGGGGGGQGNLGLASIAGNAIGNAAISTLSRFGQNRIGDATTSDILASQFSAVGGGGKAAWLHGLGLAGFGGYSRADDRQAASTLATIINPSAVKGSAYQNAKNQINSSLTSGLFPGIQVSEFASTLAQGAVPQTRNTLRQFGINTVDPKTGAVRSVPDIAKQLINTTLPARFRNANGLRRSLETGGTLDSLLSGSGYTGASRATLEDALRAEITGGKGASTIDSQTRKLANAKDKAGLQTDQSVVSGAVAANQVQQFGQAVKSFALSSSLIAKAVGTGTGFGQGLGSKALGVAAGALVPGVGLIAHAFGIGGSVPGSAGGMGSTAGGGGGRMGGTGGASPSGGGAAGSQAGSAKTAPSLKHVWPVGPGNISQPFNGTSHHPGVDFSRAGGTPIHSAADGVVIFAGPGSGFGSHYIVVHHPGENKVTRYGHGSAQMCQVGDNVKAGTVIAAVGTEGKSTGNHLHLELANGSAVWGNVSSNMDPIPWLGGAGVSASTDTGTTSGASSSSSSSSSSTSSASSGQSGFGTISIAEGRTSSLLQGGGAAPSPSRSSAMSAGSSSSAGSSTPPGGAGTGAAGSLGGTVTSPANEKLANKMMAAAGWTKAGIAKVDAIWTQESGFNQFAQNPSGGPYNAAYGIPQSDPGSKMASAGADWLTNPATQIAWGINYINSAYGGPDKAYATKARIGSYAKGSWELERDQLAMVHKGEMIVPSAAAAVMRQGVTAGGNTTPVRINIYMQNASNAEMMRVAQTVKRAISTDTLHAALATT